MIYLKLFEAFDKSEYYQEINDVEYSTLKGIQYENCIKFTTKEKRQLRALRIYNGCYSRMMLQNRSVSSDITYPDKFYIDPYANKHPLWSKGEYPDTFKLGNSHWIVNKLEDEWFVVQMYSYLKESSIRKFWKCDQLEGVEVLLRDQGIVV
jgi:hypothetical protein